MYTDDELHSADILNISTQLVWKSFLNIHSLLIYLLNSLPFLPFAELTPPPCVIDYYLLVNISPWLNF